MIDYLAISQGNCLAFRVSGKVSLEQEQHWIAELQKVIDEYGRIRIMMILEDGAHWAFRRVLKTLSLHSNIQRNSTRSPLFPTAR